MDAGQLRGSVVLDLKDWSVGVRTVTSEAKEVSGEMTGNLASASKAASSSLTGVGQAARTAAEIGGTLAQASRTVSETLSSTAAAGRSAGQALRQTGSDIRAMATETREATTAGQQLKESMGELRGTFGRRGLV